MADNIKIIGIDPGTNVMGYGLLEAEGSKVSLIVMGILKLNRLDNHYERLNRIYERVSGLITQYSPTCMAIEAPFFGKNVQSMLKLGRAQGVAMAAAIHHGIPITEYAPLKIKLSVTGSGGASKEQVADMLKRILHISDADMNPQLDATDAVGAALCHYYQMSSPVSAKSSGTWKDYLAKNPDKVVK
ncbi:MAG: crossover junction endodeoxyribonuclease RuvC [Bacteroidales bacterium]